MQLRGTVLGLCIVCTSGCGRADETAGTLADTTVDSAGVEIITHSRRTVREVSPLGAVEELRIGSADGPPETQFATIATVIEADDGSIWLYDPRNSRISVFRADGAFIRSFGRRGSGPGEFGASIMGMTLTGDTLLFLEIDRAHAFDRTGALLHTHITQTGRIRQFVRWPVATPAGIAVQHWGLGSRDNPSGGPYQDSTSIRMIDPATAQVGPTIRSFPRAPFYLVDKEGWVMAPLFQPEPRVGVIPNGWMFFTDGDDYSIDFHDAAGALVRRVRADVERIRVTDEDMREYVDRELAQTDGGGEGVVFRKAFAREAERIGHAEFRPVVGRILAGRDGSLLVERLDLDDEPLEEGDDTMWDLIDATGRIAGRVDLRSRMTPQSFTGTHVYAVARDDDDVQYLVRYRLL